MAQRAARRGLTHIERFLLKEHPEGLLENPAPFPATVESPFVPTRERERGWRAPKYSLRQQNVLRKEARMFGFPIEVLPPPYRPDPAKREGPSSSSSTSRSTALSSLISSRLRPVRPPARERSLRDSTTLKPTDVLPESKILEQVAIEKKGPYVGRTGSAFKGKVWERNYEARQAEIKAAAEQADDKIAAHRKASFFCATLLTRMLTLC